MLLASDDLHGNVKILHRATSVGNIGVWAAVVDILKGEGLLEEVNIESRRAAP